jgi:uncharacterized membrane protein
MFESARLAWHGEEAKLLNGIRARRASMRMRATKHAAEPADERSTGARVSDAVAAAVGSWRFIIIQSCLLVIWMVINVVGWVQAWDPYPFILLNLVLSFQAAYTAPIIMMSQNRQSEKDRDAAQHDYDVNLKSELEIELLHQKIDMMREQEITHLLAVIQDLHVELQLARGLREANAAAQSSAAS